MGDPLDRMVFVSRRVVERDLRPGFVYREAPDTADDSGWRAVVGDETAADADDPAAILLKPLRVLLARWPELGPVVATGTAGSAWAWDEASGRYVALPEGA